MYRFLILISAVIMQMCLGATYSWSVYVASLKTASGIGQGIAQLPFSLFYFTFPATMVAVGSMLHRFGVRRCAMLGGLIFGSGWLLAGWGNHWFGFTVLGIGVLAGIGVGFAYMVPIATSILWFPLHKGLVTGIAVAGFGGGAALVSQIGGLLMYRYGLDPFQTFHYLGITFLILVLISGSAMSQPPGYSLQTFKSIRTIDILKNRTFVYLYICMLSGLAAGFTINANLKELNLDLSVADGILGVSLFAMANALGRISWGLFYDRFQNANMVRFNLLAQAGLLLAGIWILQSKTGFLVFATIAGFNYGGVLVVYASTIAGKWGSNRVGQVYAWLFSANIPAAMAPLIAGFIFDQTGHFTYVLISLSAVLLITAFIFARTPNQGFEL